LIATISQHKRVLCTILNVDLEAMECHENIHGLKLFLRQCFYAAPCMSHNSLKCGARKTFC